MSASKHRSQRPDSSAFRDIMMNGWAPRRELNVQTAEVSSYTTARRAGLSALIPGVRAVIPAGPLKVRSNDTDYRFRPHSAFAHLTGLGTDQEPDAVLVLHPTEPGTGDAGGDHHAVLYVRPLAPRDHDEFFADARYGEFWVGPRPTLADVSRLTGIEARHIDQFADDLAKDAGSGSGSVQIAVVPGADAAVAELVAHVRQAAGLSQAAMTEKAAELIEAAALGSVLDESAALSVDEVLDRVLSELRLVKDEFEVAQMRLAVEATIDGFAQIGARLDEAMEHPRGERVVETAFDAHARLVGNTVGYETIAASGEHATILHWIRNDGLVRDGDLILVDAGVEVDSLYTADITRTLPVNGKFSEVQRRVYEAVLAAADAAFDVAIPGALFRDVHAAAMEVIAEKLHDWGLLPVSVEESLAASGQHHRRWMVHGTSHHLGLDVHDCAAARREMYLDKRLEPGMIFTIEPGLYFKSDDLTVPEEYRGIGVRIEDDVLVTETGNENLSAALPRTIDGVETWLAALRGNRGER